MLFADHARAQKRAGHRRRLCRRTPATKLTADKIYPAVSRQFAALKDAAAKATHDAGVWKLKDGEAYYAWLLKVGTTTPMSAEQVHQMGLEQNAQIEARMDGLLKKQGLSKGSVGDRMTALSRDKRFVYPETDAARGQILDYLNQLIAKTRLQMPRLSALKTLKAPVLVKRACRRTFSDGAPLGYMRSGRHRAGSRPSTYYLSISKPMRRLAALSSAHPHPCTKPFRATPGRSAYPDPKPENCRLIRIILSGFNAYVEGWSALPPGRN